MSSGTLFIDTNVLPREKSPSGESAEILNGRLAGAKNVVGSLRWIQPGGEFHASPLDRHQLLYLMEGAGRIGLEGKDYDVRKGAGVYLGPGEGATIHASARGLVKVFHLVVPQIPK